MNGNISENSFNINIINLLNPLEICEIQNSLNYFYWSTYRPDFQKWVCYVLMKHSIYWVLSLCHRYFGYSFNLVFRMILEAWEKYLNFADETQVLGFDHLLSELSNLQGRNSRDLNPSFISKPSPLLYAVFNFYCDIQMTTLQRIKF